MIYLLQTSMVYCNILGHFTSYLHKTASVGLQQTGATSQHPVVDVYGCYMAGAWERCLGLGVWEMYIHSHKYGKYVDTCI